MAALGAEWFAAGFVHGVLNTDNVSITGESFDYGPWRFLDRYDPGFTAAYFDQTGLYAFARQPEALNWNLARLGECLIPLSSRAAIEPSFESFPERFQAALTRQTFARLGLLPGDDPAAARALMHRFWGAMQETAPPFQQVFHDLLGAGCPTACARARCARSTRPRPGPRSSRTCAPSPRPPASPTRPPPTAPETMVIAEVEAIWSAIDRDDDWAPARREDRGDPRRRRPQRRARPAARAERPPRAPPARLTIKPADSRTPS